MVYAKTRICPIKWDAQNSLGFWKTNRTFNLGYATRPSDSEQKKRIYQIVDFAVAADHSEKSKKREGRDKYLHRVRKLKSYGTWSWRWYQLLIVHLEQCTKGLVKRLEDLEIWRQVEAFQTTALLRSARILRRVLETWGDLLSFRLQWKIIS